MQFLSAVDCRDAKVTANYAQMVLYGYTNAELYMEPRLILPRIAEKIFLAIDLRACIIDFDRTDVLLVLMVVEIRCSKQ